MATSYVLQVGYPSMFDRSEMAEKLIEIVEAIQANPQMIVDEAIRLEPDRDVELLREYSIRYVPPVADLTLTSEVDEIGLPIFRQLASGGGESRDVKESLRRAFCRLVIEAMHRARMEVSLLVC